MDQGRTGPVFLWHPLARLTAGQGDPQPWHAMPQPVSPVLPDRPAGPALRAALALAAAGSGFRIGGTGLCEAGPGQFETLTGGSLGQPRQVLRSQASWLASFAVDARLFGIGPGVRVAIPGRLSHSLSLYGALCGMHLGAEVHLLDGLRPDRMARALADRAIGLIWTTPVHLAQMLAHAPCWPDLRTVIAGGARLDPALRMALARIAPGATVREFYGAAETSFITLTDGSDGTEGAADGQGRPYPQVDLSLRDRAGYPVPDGQEGEVWVRSPYLFERYSGADPGSARWKDGWLSVGEVAVMTPGGLHLRGRAGRMVTIGGQNVFPEEIEQFLAGLPGIARVAVLARPDAQRGHVLWAVASGDRDQEAAAMAAARARLGPLIAPRGMLWRDDWPDLPSGKTDLAALAAALPWR